MYSNQLIETASEDCLTEWQRNRRYGRLQLIQTVRLDLQIPFKDTVRLLPYCTIVFHSPFR